MDDLNSIQNKLKDMSKLALKMWQMTHRTFMEHNADLVPQVFEDENTLNNMEKDIAADLVKVGKNNQDAQVREKALLFAEVVEDFELIGDYCKDILERVQIKIEERLLFPEDAVKEYDSVYVKTLEALDEIAFAFERGDLSLVKIVLRKEEHIDYMVDEYRKKQNERMIQGVCTPMACNMFLNMLDFTAGVYYHAKKIARNLLKIK
jgi:phosphate:Na+ symporter